MRQEVKQKISPDFGMIFHFSNCLLENTFLEVNAYLVLQLNIFSVFPKTFLEKSANFFCNKKLE